jgi:hypothetical protein
MGRLAEELSAVGDIISAKEAVAEVVAREPNSAVARTLAAAIALLEKFGETVSPAVPRRHGLGQVWLDFSCRPGKIFRS